MLEVIEVDFRRRIWVGRRDGVGRNEVVRVHTDTRPVVDEGALPVSAVMPEARNDHAMRPDSPERSMYGNTDSSSKTTGVKGIPLAFGGHTGCAVEANLTVRVRARLLVVLPGITSV